MKPLIGREHRLIQPHGRPGHDEEVLPERIAQGVLGLFEVVDGVICVALWPEDPDDTFGSDTGLAVGGREGEQGQTATPLRRGGGGGTWHEAVCSREGETTERGEAIGHIQGPRVERVI